ncbi:MAG: metallophosphoesterase family protein, partial [Candidatus Promineifilaceae bacterium]
LSDTHMPQRWHEIPKTLPDIFKDVDFILHAGDVGELWVLDQLSEIAPVIAVHGNDEPQEAITHLPLSQIVTIAGTRILVWHSHYEDRVDEMESRRLLPMRPKLERIARYGRRVGASIVHFGHWHIPLQCKIEGVRLVNAGGIASGNDVTRQILQTVVVLEIEKDGRFQISHYDLADGRLHHPPDIVDTDFTTALGPYHASILMPELEAKIPVLRTNPLLNKTLWELAPLCWWGNKTVLTTADFTTALQDITPQTADIQQALSLLE